ncbi:hypothetical protein K9M79_00840 [Candidatus Woesearchaeota archaeon]|nr:hypothetical protein [Candidatus Woesearchaeota archaeon]
MLKIKTFYQFLIVVLLANILLILPAYALDEKAPSFDFDLQTAICIDSCIILDGPDVACIEQCDADRPFEMESCTNMWVVKGATNEESIERCRGLKSFVEYENRIKECISDSAYDSDIFLFCVTGPDISRGNDGECVNECSEIGYVTKACQMICDADIPPEENLPNPNDVCGKLCSEEGISGCDELCSDHCVLECLGNKQSIVECNTMCKDNRIRQTESTDTDDEEKVRWTFEFWAMVGVFVALGAGAVGWHYSKIHRKKTIEYLENVDQVFNSYRTEKDICYVKLEELKNTLKESFKKDNIDETNFDFILKRIEKYEKELRKE